MEGILTAWVLAFPSGLDGEESACQCKRHRVPLGWEDPLEKRMAILSSVLAWRIPWTEKHGRLQSMGSQTAGYTE